MSRPTTSLISAIGISIGAAVIANILFQSKRLRLQPTPPLTNAFNRVGQLLGVHNVSLKSSLEQNGFWAVRHDIYFNPAWTLDVLRRHCRNSSCANAILHGVVAHEFGHVLFGDSGYGPRCDLNHHSELRADAVAGWALANLGFEASHFDMLLQELAAEVTCTHPQATARSTALWDGYQSALQGQPHQALRAYPHS